MSTADGIDNPWPLADVLRKLAFAAEHLGAWHDCDHHGYEEVIAAKKMAYHYLATPLIGPDSIARTVVGSVFDNTYASTETLKRVMTERIKDFLHWQFTHEHDAELIRKDGLMCEAHPGLEFGHDPNCGGPGMAWVIEGRAAIESLAAPESAKRPISDRGTDGQAS